LSTKTTPSAPAAFARATFEPKVQKPRETSAIEPVSDPDGKVLPGASTLLGGPQRRRSTGLPSVPTIVPMSTSFWSIVVHAGGVVLGPWLNGIAVTPAGAVTVSVGEKTCAFETAATLIASGAVPGAPTLPRPKSSRSFPAEMTGTTPAAATLRTASTSASFAGSSIGPPPEKLITSIPSATASSKAATICGVKALFPTGVGALNTR
jgi:hypothetical protein